MQKHLVHKDIIFIIYHQNFKQIYVLPAHINGNDIVIKDRLEDIYPHNVSFCSKGCELSNIDIDSKIVNCSFNISYSEQNLEENVDINNNQTKLNESDNFVIYLLDSLNYKIFLCYKIILKLQIKDLVNNLGFYFGIGFILFNIICCFIFSIYFLPKLRIQVYKLLPSKKILLEKIDSFKTQINEKSIKNETKSTKNIITKNIANLNFVLQKNSGKKKIRKKKINSKKNKDNEVDRKDSRQKIIR